MIEYRKEFQNEWQKRRELQRLEAAKNDDDDRPDRPDDDETSQLALDENASQATGDAPSEPPPDNSISSTLLDLFDSYPDPPNSNAADAEPAAAPPAPG